jgi:phosphoglycolate phosphatase
MIFIKKINKGWKMISNVIFDLDGTLIDSKEDVYDCFINSYKTHNIDISTVKNWVMGQPLKEMILSYTPDISEEKLDSVIKTFKNLYDNYNYPKTKIYKGVNVLLKSLQESNIKLFVATNKRLVPTKNLITGLSMDVFCDISSPDIISNKTLKKEEMISYLLSKWKINNNNVIMVGDASSDIKAARKNNIRSVAVLNGYGTRDELFNSNADYVIDDISLLGKLINELNKKGECCV